MLGYLCLALVPMLCVTGYNYSKTREILLEKSYENIEYESDQMKQNISTLLEPYLTTLDILYIDQSLSGYLAEDYSRDSYEEMFYYIDKKISGICLINPTIKKICFYSNNTTLPEDNYYFFSETLLPEKNKQKAREALGEVVLTGMNSQERGMQLCMERLMNVYPNGGVESIASLEIENDVLDDLVTAQNSEEEIFLTDSDGMILAASDPMKTGDNIKLWMPEWEKGTKEQHVEFTVKNNAKIGISRAVAFDTYVVMLSDKGMLLKNAKDISGRMLFLILLSGILVLVFISLYTRWISGRVNKVVYAAKKLGDGDFDYVLSDMGKDEIGQIGDAFNRLNKRIRNLIRENYERKIKLQTSELNLMQEQINPHFLYNALSVISAMAMRERENQTVKSVKYLADFYRISLNKGKQTFSIREEIELLQNYMKIQNMRFGDSVQVEYEVKKDVLPLKTIKLLLQPLVENSIHHGRKGEEILHIWVKVTLVNGDVCFSVRDDGCGIPKERLYKLRHELENFDEGYGLKNIHNRVRLTYGEAYGVQISSVYGTGTTVLIYIPQIQ